MKILFSFECCRIPLRAITLINWLVTRGHTVDVLYDEDIANEPMEAPHLLKNCTIYKTLSTPMNKGARCIERINDYDIWFADLLNHKNYAHKSYYNRYFKNFKNLLCLISLDDGSDFFNHRLEDELHSRVGGFLNNLIERDLSVYHPEVAKKHMLLPTYIEASNEAYDEYTSIYNLQLTPYLEKVDWVYFSGAITGCMPGVDCRTNSIVTASRSGVSYNIRVNGTDPTPFLKFFYDYVIDKDLKRPMVDRLTFLKELNTHKIILSPKGNCQPVRRQYEGFAFNTLVFINENNTVDYLYEGTPDVHFVKYKLDCSDLKEKINFYINNPSEGQKIADAGTKFWEENCRIYPDGRLSANLENTLVESFKNMTGVTL